MALDAGNVNIRINAQTGDTKQRIDEVRNSLDSLNGTSKLVKAAMATAVTVVASKAADLAGNLYSSLVVPMQRASRDINSTGQAAQDQLSALGGAAASVADNIPIVGGLISGIITGQTQLAVEEMTILNGYKDDLKKNIDEVAAYSDEVLTNSAITGFSTEMVQVYMAMQGITDVDYSTIETGMRFFKSALDDATKGSGEAYEALKLLGVGLTNPDGSNKTLTEMWIETSEAIQQNKGELDEIKLWGVETALFGSRAAEGMQPIFKNSELSYTALYDLASGIALLNNTQLELGGQMKNLQDLAKAADETKNKILGLRFAEKSKASSQAELDYLKVAMAKELGEINPETGLPYTAYDVAKAMGDWKREELALDVVQTLSAKELKKMDEKTTEAAKTSLTPDEMYEKLAEDFPDIPMMIYGATDQRNKENLYNYYLNNLDKFDPELQATAAYSLLAQLEGDRAKDYEEHLGSTKYGQLLDLAWGMVEGNVMYDRNTLNEIMYGAMSFADRADFALSSLFYQGSPNDLYAAAHPLPLPEQKIAAAEPSTQIEQQQIFDGGSRADSHDDNRTINYYGAEISLGDAT